MTENKLKIYTDGGATADSEVGYYGGWGIYIEGEGEKDSLVLYQASPHGTTNNQAEGQAFIEAAKYAITARATYVQFFIDSRYIIDGHDRYLDTWKRNFWIKADGQPVKNREMWEEIDATRDRLHNANVKYKIDWVKGHSGIVGNEIADEGATRATALAKAHDFDLKIGDPKDFLPNKEIDETAVDVMSLKEPSALLCGRRMLDVVNADQLMVGDKLAYITVNFDDKDPIKARGLGVMAGDRMDGLVVLETPDPLYTMIRAKQNAIDTAGLIKPFTMYWDKLKGTKTIKAFNALGEGNLNHVKENILLVDGSAPATHYLDPPRQARRCLEQAEIHKQMLIELQSDDCSFEVQDVTGLFFESDDKGVKTIRKDIAKVKSVKTKYQFDDRSLDIIMSFDCEVPNRNTLNKLLKQDKEVSVKLVISDKTKNTFRWYLYIETPNGRGIFCNPATNLSILPH